MSIIANHHTLNIAYDGQHFARVEFPALLDEKTVKLRSTQIAWALKEEYGTPTKWSFSLTACECSGRPVQDWYMGE